MLIGEIIGILSNQANSLTEALLKTKILLHSIGRKELASWVNKELNGYSADDELPAYRVLPAVVLANISNMAWRAQAHPIPLLHLEPSVRSNLQEHRVYQSLSVIEEMSRNEAVGRPIPLEFNAFFDRVLDNGFHVEKAWSQVSKHDLLNIPVQVRSRLLDFMLELKDSIGEPKSESELREKTTAVDATTMFNNAIFGSNTTILVGNQNVQTVKIGGRAGL